MDQKILSPVIFVLTAFLGISCAGGSLKASRSDLSAVDHSLQQSKLRADISAMNIGLKIPDSGALFKIEVPFSSAVLISLSSTGEIFAADGKRGVYYSKDDGLNWSKSPIEFQCRQFLPITSEQILAVCQEELFSYRSGVWTKIPLPKGLHKTLTPQQVAAG